MLKERWEILLESINNKMDMFADMVNALKKKNEQERQERSIKRKNKLLSLEPTERLLFLTSAREIRVENARKHFEWRKNLEEKFNAITRIRDEKLKDLRDSRNNMGAASL